jgi:nicotinamide-nucleotide amidase
MALGALEHSHGTLALAVTGVAGPGGGSREKPVGMVCFAWASRAGDSSTETRHFSGDREAVRKQSVEHVLARMLELLDST